ncbi:MAG: 30S ribosomal protein S12 methylthiotransferase RimO [Synergistetes bacterium]|nr:30S ribosomal protein S12 methylthiotransferase RimO [Synergistota bacterium]MCX8127864.1 30S ribosomal protein S12 methylthiotransferase RimO [Synergistota bacterium]MDW8192126.1 30S ribosomal protein S12 methylthiotransferase RimO [Synergistota bacterium]
MRFGIISLGCPKNEVDSELIAGKLVEAGLDYSSSLEDVDLVVLNTCAFIDSAVSESYSWLKKLVQLKREGVIKRIALVGCLVQRLGERSLKELEEVDYFAGTSYPQEVGEFLFKALKNKAEGEFFLKPFPDRWVESGLRFPLKKTFYAYVKIAEGCNNRCSYCVIPNIRGPYRARPLDEILKEVEDFIRSGKKEVVLVSQDSTLYPLSLSLLLRKLSELGGDFWVRVLYLHPAKIDGELVETILSLEKVCSYFDIPIQHVDDNVLFLMNRPYGEGDLRKLFDKIRSLDMLACLRTTIMVGFPGERKSSFQRLIDFVSDIKFDRLGSFLYSPQREASSYIFKPVPFRVSKRRRDTLMELQKEISKERNSLFVGKTLKVLVEKPGIGRSYRDAPEIDGLVYLDKSAEVGNFVNVKIIEVGDHDLWGEVI